MPRRRRRLAAFRHVVLLLCAILPVAAFGILPLAAFLVKAAFSVSFLSLESRQILLLGRTAAFAGSVALLATAIGVIAGFRLGATRWRGSAAFRALFILPLLIPPYLHALGWTMFLRADGPVSRLMMQLGLPREFTTEWAYSFWGGVVVLSLAYCPLVLLLTDRALGFVPLSLIETADVYGASRLQAFRFAYWPFIRPWAILASLCIFLLAACELGVPTILKIPVFNYEVFTQLSAFSDVGTATLLSIPLLLLGLVALVVEQRIASTKIHGQDAQDVTQMPIVGSARARSSFLCLGALLLFCFGLPFGSMFTRGFGHNALSIVFAMAVQPAWNTLYYGVAATAIIALLGLVMAWTTLRKGHGQAFLIDVILVIGLAIPGTITALAIMSLYDKPGVTHWMSASTLVVGALVVRYSMVGFRGFRIALGQLPLELFDAASLDGATTLSAFRWIIAPLVAPAVVAILCLTFVLCVGELGTTILLYPPGGETLPITLYTIEANSPADYTAAMALIEVAFCLVPVILLLVAVRRQSSRTG